MLSTLGKAHHSSWKAGIAQSVSAQPSEPEGLPVQSHHLINVCFNFPLFCVAVALNTHKMEH